MWGAFLLLLLVTTSYAEIIRYDGRVIEAARPEYLKIPKFASHDAPNWAPGKGRSFIDLSDLALLATCEQEIVADPGIKGSGDQDAPCVAASNFDILLFKEPDGPDDKYWQNYWPGRQFCCSAVAVDDGYCDRAQLNKLIIPDDLPGAFSSSFKLNTNEVVKFSDNPLMSRHDIKESGVYILMMASCDVTSPDVTLGGQIESMDPYGYLPADLFGNLPFYMVLSGLYSILAVCWAVVCFTYFDQIIALQMWITSVLALGMIETTSLCAHYDHWNLHGLMSINLMMTGVVFGIAKRTFSRVVVLLLSLGYGVVKPSLGDDMPKVVQLGCAYFSLSVVYVIVTMFPSKHKGTEDPDMDYVSVIVFLLAAVDTVFYIWIIQSINSLLASLAARQQGMKYLLYRNFRAVLFMALFFAIIWGLYSSVVMYDDGSPNDSSWQSRWTVDALWELTYFVVLAAIAQMWAPSSNSQRYAYHTQLSSLEDDEEYAAAGDIELAERRVDAEYGGGLDDADDPFKSSGGGMDVRSAISKKQ